MPTDDERRRVAEAFRRYREETTNKEFATIFDVFDACGLTYYDGVVLYDRLADLIDPGESGQNLDTNRDSVPIESPAVQKATECDREALLALANEMVAIAGTYPKKGSTSPLFLRFARRIREACGEVVE